MSTVYEFEYADMSKEFSTEDWVYDLIQWVPMVEKDRDAICEQYNDEEFEWDYSKLSQWLVYIAGPMGELDDWSIVLIPCAPDGSSGFDTPFIEIYDIGNYDATVARLQTGWYE